MPTLHLKKNVNTFDCLDDFYNVKILYELLYP